MDILNLSHNGLVKWFSERGVEAFRAGQVLKWILQKRCDTFLEMSDIKKSLRVMLTENFRITRPEVVDVQSSADGTSKYLFRLSDDLFIESVLIPERGHFTLCVSSQVGCAMGCRFCATGGLGFKRNLMISEIVSQVLEVRGRMEDPLAMKNIVFMGMGEPLANFENLLGALEMITDSSWGLGFSKRRVTVSTAGMVQMIDALGVSTGVNLAVSLNATDNEVRSSIMPINKRYPIEMLLAACDRYPLGPHRRITFEYVMIKGVNDSIKDAGRLVSMLAPKRSKINLIMLNENDASPFQPPGEERVERFKEYLAARNFTVMLRKSKGRDISAACGQLAAKHSGSWVHKR